MGERFLEIRRRNRRGRRKAGNGKYSFLEQIQRGDLQIGRVGGGIIQRCADMEEREREWRETVVKSSWSRMSP